MEYQSAFQIKREEKIHGYDVCRMSLSKKVILDGLFEIQKTEKSYICLCKESFSKNSDLTRHIKLYSVKETKGTHLCNTCKKAFLEKTYLERQ